MAQIAQSAIATGGFNCIIVTGTAPVNLWITTSDTGGYSYQINYGIPGPDVPTPTQLTPGVKITIPLSQAQQTAYVVPLYTPNGGTQSQYTTINAPRNGTQATCFTTGGSPSNITIQIEDVPQPV